MFVTLSHLKLNGAANVRETRFYHCVSHLGVLNLSWYFPPLSFTCCCDCDATFVEPSDGYSGSFSPLILRLLTTSQLYRPLTFNLLADLRCHVTHMTYFVDAEKGVFRIKVLEISPSFFPL